MADKTARRQTAVWKPPPTHRITDLVNVLFEQGEESGFRDQPSPRLRLAGPA